MSGKVIFKKMYAALERNVAASHETHMREILKKQDALVQYKPLVEEVKKTFASQMPKLDIGLLKYLDKEQHHPVEEEHLRNLATFLDSQREYVELLERYNPGISMKQTDKVRKTARRVGLDVPE
ncbi:hypothetical protein CAS74_005026 [Pichia kudriavzevii]|uniref:ATP synthase assembly factor FMC1, mitochondrial n=1 Tax=Pichia kudriavzevii TaxID=4909 RepID=A0A1Z8JH46_PICKU|nr:hypothetical protein CAS74_005026 [Pichia kudriavzevii]